MIDRRLIAAAMLAVAAPRALRAEVVQPLANYSNPTPIAGERFGQYVHSNGAYAFVADSAAKEDGLRGAAYQFDLTSGALIHTFGSPEGANENDFGEYGGLGSLGDNLLVGDWGAKRLIGTIVSFGGLAYRFSISSGQYLQTYSPVGHGVNSGGDYGMGIVGVGTRVCVGWPFLGSMEVYDVTTGAFLNRYDFVAPQHFGAPLRALGSNVVSGDISASTPRFLRVFNPATGTIVTGMPDPRPTGSSSQTSLFGYSLATNAAADRILTGAYRAGAAPNIGQGDGAAYLFDSSGTLLRSFDPPAGVGGFFGWSVAFLGENVLVGAINNNASTGVVCLFDSATGALLRQYDGYGQGSLFGYSLSTVDSSRFLVGSLGVAYLLPGELDPCAAITPDGDMNGSGAADGADIPGFLDALLNGLTVAPDRCHADFDHDGVVDLTDVPAFAAALLGP